LARLYATRYLVTNTKTDADRAKNELENEILQYADKVLENLKSLKMLELITIVKDNRAQYYKAFTDIETIITQRNDYIDNTLNIIGPEVAGKLEQVKLSVKKDQDALGPLVQAENKQALTLVTIIAVVSVFAGIFISWTMMGLIRRPIGGEPRKIEEITTRISNGDLSQDLQVSDKDSGIYLAICNMSEKLRSLIGSIISSSASLIESANESSSISLSNVETAKNQKQMTETVTDLVDKMSDSIVKITTLVAQSEEKSKVGIAETGVGRDKVKVAVASINELSENLNNSMDTIKNLKTQSIEINSVIEVIRGISEQTNLLALNAAIEAARAGDQGRGFAVVADEVRGLAQRTQESTTEIQTIIQNLQLGTSQTVSIMEQSVEQAKNSVELSIETDTALSSIYEVINDISDMNSQVVEAVAQQSKISINVKQNMLNINAACDDAISQAQSAEATSSNVKNMAAELNQLAGGFKV
jgi:methyl-accepting chemotaxis protein